jgi:hypothetical protein
MSFACGTPRALARAVSKDDPGAARRAFEAMMTMQKINASKARLLLGFVWP